MSVKVEVSGIAYRDGSVWVAEGVVTQDEDAETEDDGITVFVPRSILGRHVRFAGDWRPMRDVEAALERGETVVVDVEGWQFI